MKRSKFEERTLRPIFPRLHVNDTERGGPRAPPRNKMALYEQLTVPSSNRCKPASMHVSPNSCSNLVPTASSSKAPPFPSHIADRLQRHAYDVANSKYPASQAEQRRKPQDEDDFAVPIFCRPGRDRSDDPKQGRHDERRFWAFNSCYPVLHPNDCDEHQKEVNSGCPRLMHEREAKDREFMTAFVPRSDPAIRRSAEILAQESPEGPSQLQEDALMNVQSDTNKTSRLKYSNANSRCSDTSLRSLKEEKGRITSKPKSSSLLGLSNRNEFDSEVEENQRDQRLRRENTGRHDHASQTSTVATISGSDISPDDVVGVLGLKRFWKARKAIVNQQRLFAVQVFELHRLIKVQKLIAESPEILLEPSTFVGQSSLKATPLKKHPSRYAVLKAAAESDRQKDNSQKPDDDTEMEVIAENTVVEAPASQPEPLSHYPFAVNTALGSQAAPPPEPPPFIATDSKAGPMPFLLPGGSQWLVPVMSPSEGLIFKPYPGPGYGVAPSPYYHQQGIPFNPQAYFPPYGMQTMNSLSTVDQINRLSGSNRDGRKSQMPNSSLPQQGSCNTKSRKQSEVFGSTCSSSPSKRARDTAGTGSNTKEKEGLTPFPSTPTAGVPERAHEPNTLVKVVPHNARTATESAARIFRLIQEERRQHRSD